nr:hypothetical protein L203_06477 [Cryptococcus depauperatus CBS 7841]
MCGGDKDTFRWAWRMLDIPFGVSPKCKPPPLFVHSNLLKHLGATGLGRGDLFTHIRCISNNTASSAILNYAHAFVYQIETFSTDKEEGGIFDGSEEMWLEGGRIGETLALANRELKNDN